MLEIGAEHGWPTLPQVHRREPSLGVTEGGSPALPKEARRAQSEVRHPAQEGAMVPYVRPVAKEEPLLWGHLTLSA